MKKKVLWRLLLISITVVLAVVFFLPNTPVFQHMPDWWKKNMPGKGIVLGLDLQGGLHLVFEVEGDKAVEITTDRYASQLRDLFVKKNITTDVSVSGLTITVSPSSAETKKLIADNFPIFSAAESGDRKSVV